MSRKSLPISGLILLLSLLAAVSLAYAQLLPEASSPEAASLPQLETLKTGWWDYFDPDLDEAEERQAAFVSNLKEGLARLNPAQREEGERLILAVENNLATYIETAGRTAIEPESLPVSSEQYSLAQLLRLLDASRVAGRLVADYELELNRALRKLDGDGRARDRAFKDYISQAAGMERWLQGLRLVQSRSQEALSELRLSKVEAEYESAQQVQQEFLDRLSYARSRLVVPAEEDDLEKAGARVVEVQQEFAKALVSYGKAELEAAGFAFSDEAGKAEQRVLRQKAYQMGVKLMLREVATMQIEAENWLTGYFSNDRPGLSGLKEQEQIWLAAIDEIEVERRESKADLEEEILLVQAAPKDDKSRKIRNLFNERMAIATDTLSKLNALENALEDLSFTLDVLNEVAASRVGRLKRWAGVAYAQLLTSWTWLEEASAETLFEIGETPITGDDVLMLIWVIVFAVILSKVVRKGLARMGDSVGAGNQAGLYTFGRLFHYFIIFVAILVALGSIGIDFSSLAFVAGALSVGIGFGLQNIVNNFVSGLIILFEGTLRVGDYIELDTGVTGTVKAINARSTLINTNDNIDIIVPNSEIASNKLTNWTLGEYILRVRIPFGVAYGTDKELVKKAAIEAANNVHFTLKNMKGREPDVWLVEFGDSSMNYLLLVWVNRQGARRPTRTLANYLWALDDSFREHGIEVPFPQRDLHLRSGFDKIPAPDENT